MKGKSDEMHSCPECGGRVCRVHRHIGDRLIALFLNVRRYRCENPECAWEGIISGHPVLERRAGSLWPGRLLWMSVGVVFTLTSVAGLKFYRSAALSKPSMAAIDVAPALAVRAGESFDGVTLPEKDRRGVGNPTDLSLRRGCAWGIPGRQPYKGTTRQALVGARLPTEVVNKIEAMAERGIISDHVDIRSDSIQSASGKRRFDTTLVAMAFAETLCFGTRVNFRPGHVERGDLYDATDATGRNYAVMVPYACGNVSVLAERAERPEEGHRNGSTPEPGTLAILVAGLGAMLALHWRRRRSSSARNRP